MLGNFSYVLSCLLSVDFFFKIIFFEKFFQEYQSVNILSCLICIQKLSAADTSKQRMKEGVVFGRVTYTEELTRVL